MLPSERMLFFSVCNSPYRRWWPDGVWCFFLTIEVVVSMLVVVDVDGYIYSPSSVEPIVTQMLSVVATQQTSYSWFECYRGGCYRDRHVCCVS